MAIIKSSKDTRYAVDSIVTHDGEKLPCWPLAKLSSFKQKFGVDAYDQVSFFEVLQDVFNYLYCRESNFYMTTCIGIGDSFLNSLMVCSIFFLFQLVYSKINPYDWFM